jgi:hypothetical protein
VSTDHLYKTGVEEFNGNVTSSLPRPLVTSSGLENDESQNRQKLGERWQIDEYSIRTQKPPFVSLSNSETISAKWGNLLQSFFQIYLMTLVTSKLLSVGRSQFNAHTDEQTQVCGTQSFLMVIHASTN